MYSECNIFQRSLRKHCENNLCAAKLFVLVTEASGVQCLGVDGWGYTYTFKYCENGCCDFGVQQILA